MDDRFIELLSEEIRETKNLTLGSAPGNGRIEKDSQCSRKESRGSLGTGDYYKRTDEQTFLEATF